MAPLKAVKQPVAAVAQNVAPEASNPTTTSGIDVPESNDAEDEGIISWNLSEINSVLWSCDGHIYVRKNWIWMSVFNFFSK